MQKPSQNYRTMVIYNCLICMLLICLKCWQYRNKFMPHCHMALMIFCMTSWTDDRSACWSIFTYSPLFSRMILRKSGTTSAISLRWLSASPANTIISYYIQCLKWFKKEVRSLSDNCRGRHTICAEGGEPSAFLPRNFLYLKMLSFGAVWVAFYVI